MDHHASLTNGFIKIVEPSVHNGRLTFESLSESSESFSKPALLKGMVQIDPKLRTREFYEQIDPSEQLQWRVKESDSSVSMRSQDGSSDYNYVKGQVGSGAEFLDDVFAKKLDVYSHLGTISAGYVDPYQWGKNAFNLLKKEIFFQSWFQIDRWKPSGHMFFGNSNEACGEPTHGAVGSDWHMFPTLNVFVMVAGVKKWLSCPPKLGEQFREHDKLFMVSSGREAPAGNLEADVVYVEPGDVLFNPPYEWHKVLNGRGLSIGAAFRILDLTYLSSLRERRHLNFEMVDIESNPQTEELAHLLTSLGYASYDLPRAQMLLNELEFAYLHKT